MGSDESHFNVSIGSDGQSHKTVSTNHNLFEEKGEPKRYRTEVLPPNALPLGHTGSRRCLRVHVDISITLQANVHGPVQQTTRRRLEEKPRRSEEKPRPRSEEKPRRYEDKPRPRSEEKPRPRSGEKPRRSEETPRPRSEEKPRPRSEEKPRPRSEEEPRPRYEEKPRRSDEGKLADLHVGLVSNTVSGEPVWPSGEALGW